ncbi:MAG: twin-arginine translocase subunit TatC [Candidatus Obscuribacterales bacterium]|nr:twin-arginine translocase subunit TatC [Candidatus Obscuribacterales bacterium]
MSGPEADNSIEDMTPPKAQGETLLRDDAESVEIQQFEDEDVSQLPETVPAKFPMSAVESSGEESVEYTEPEPDGKVMSVIDHLDELRTRLIRSLAAFAVSMAVCFFYGKDLIRILEVPAGNMKFQALSIEEPVIVYCKVAFYAALALVSPYLLYEICAFIAPGLKTNERKILAPIVIGGPLLFLIGGVFCYYFVLPPMLFFFNSFAGGLAPVQQRLDYYISLVTTMIIYMGICFQLPIVLFALSIAGIVNSKQLLSVWRYAIVGSSVVAAIITPDPTVVSMLIVMAALVALYFFTILLLKVFKR